MSEENEEAKERTDWAEDRTQLANERTFAAWMRTGMACVGVALGLEAIFKEFEPTWIAKMVSSLFVMGGILIFFAASRQAARTHRRLQCHSASKQPLWRIQLLSLLMATGALATGIVLWFI